GCRPEWSLALTRSLQNCDSVNRSENNNHKYDRQGNELFHRAYFPFAFISASRAAWIASEGVACFRLSSSGSAFLFWRNAKPKNPSTTKTAPATINQCGYSIAESIRQFPSLLLSSLPAVLTSP